MGLPKNCRRTQFDLCLAWSPPPLLPHPCSAAAAALSFLSMCLYEPRKLIGTVMEDVKHVISANTAVLKAGWK